MSLFLLDLPALFKIRSVWFFLSSAKPFDSAHNCFLSMDFVPSTFEPLGRQWAMIDNECLLQRGGMRVGRTNKFF